MLDAAIVVTCLLVGYFLGWLRTELSFDRTTKDLGRALKRMTVAYVAPGELAVKVRELAERLLGEKPK